MSTPFRVDVNDSSGNPITAANPLPVADATLAAALAASPAGPTRSEQYLAAIMLELRGIRVLLATANNTAAIFEPLPETFAVY